MTILRQEKIFCICVKKLILKHVGKEHSFMNGHGIGFRISVSKIEFHLFHTVPLFDEELYKITSILNNILKVTSLHKEGWDKNFLYRHDVVSSGPDEKGFMSTFKFFNDTDFSLKNGEEVIVKSNVFSF